MLFSIMCKVNNFTVWRLTPSLTDVNIQYALDAKGNILEFDNEEDADRYISRGLDLIDNSIPAEEDCTWCDAVIGIIHSPACPNGERYKQVQRILSSGNEIKEKGTAVRLKKIENTKPLKVGKTKFNLT